MRRSVMSEVNGEKIRMVRGSIVHLGTRSYKALKPMVKIMNCDLSVVGNH